jgi:hypothetical protein
MIPERRGKSAERKLKIMKTFRFETFIAGQSRFVDWYQAATQASALELALEDCHRYQIPAGFTYEIREATAREYEALKDL